MARKSGTRQGPRYLEFIPPGPGPQRTPLWRGLRWRLTRHRTMIWFLTTGCRNRS